MLLADVIGALFPLELIALDLTIWVLVFQLIFTMSLAPIILHSKVKIRQNDELKFWFHKFQQQMPLCN